MNGLEDDFVWYHRGDGGEILPLSGEMQQSLPLDSGNVNNIHVDSSFRNSEETSVSGYFMSSTEDTNRSGSSYDQVSSQGGPVESSEEGTRHFGLKLSKTPSFISLLARQLNGQSNTDPGPSSSSRQKETKKPATDKEELKASNFPALYLRIGNWQRQSRNESDLMAKCYYKKRRLVWEILEGALKSKIEIEWKDITGIKASKVEDECRVLEIELNEKPLFFKEITPQPRKHTLWQQVDDFTGGEALRYRLHYIKFAPEILDKHYEKLMQYDHRLSALCQRPFPSYNSPYFSDVLKSPQFSLDFNAHNYQSVIQYSLNQCVQPYVPSPPVQIVSIPTMPVSNIVRDGDYVQVARSIAPVLIPNNMNFPDYYILGMPLPEQNYITISGGQATGLSTCNTTTLLDKQNHLLGDMQSPDEQMALLTGITNPTYSLINLIQRVGVRTSITEQSMIQNNNDRESLSTSYYGGLVRSTVSTSLPQYDVNDVPMIQNNNKESSSTSNDGGLGWSRGSNSLPQYNNMPMTQNSNGESSSIVNDGGLEWSTGSRYNHVESQPSRYYSFYPHSFSNKRNRKF